MRKVCYAQYCDDYVSFTDEFKSVFDIDNVHYTLRQIFHKNFELLQKQKSQLTFELNHIPSLPAWPILDDVMVRHDVKRPISIEEETALKYTTVSRSVAFHTEYNFAYLQYLETC